MATVTVSFGEDDTVNKFVDTVFVAVFGSADYRKPAARVNFLSSLKLKRGDRLVLHAPDGVRLFDRSHENFVAEDLTWLIGVVRSAGVKTLRKTEHAVTSLTL